MPRSCHRYRPGSAFGWPRRWDRPGSEAAALQPLPHLVDDRSQSAGRVLVGLAIRELNRVAELNPYSRTAPGQQASPVERTAARPDLIGALQRDRNDRHLHMPREDWRALLEALDSAVDRPLSFWKQDQ